MVVVERTSLNIIPVVFKKEPEASFEIISSEPNNNEEPKVMVAAEIPKMVVVEEAESNSSDSGSEIDMQDALDTSSELQTYLR